MSSLPELSSGLIPEALDTVIQNYWENLLQDNSCSERLLQLFSQHPEFRDELTRVWVASDFVASMSSRKPALILDLYESGDLNRSYTGSDKSCYEDWSLRLENYSINLAEQKFSSYREVEKELKHLLRIFRQREIMRIIWRDITAKACLVEICADMSAMADVCLQFALKIIHLWCCKEMGQALGADGKPQFLLVIAMGKYGARELNVSSDIDLIFTFPEIGETVPIENTDLSQKKFQASSKRKFFIRQGQRLIDVLGSVTEDGFVFRVDMRLRPYGSAGALALSFDAMEEYYQSQGRDWERFAMIKARVVAGNMAAGKQLLETLRPFVYRRYLDFSAIDALREMKSLISRQVKRKGMKENIKLGDGGIREIEFVVQVIQLIHGGKNRKLQDPNLLKVLKVLVTDGYIEEKDGSELQGCYFFLRNLEHKLQALSDKQTHKLPADSISRLRVAKAMGYDNWEKLSGDLEKVREKVSGHFSALIAEPKVSLEQKKNDNKLLQTLWEQELDEEKSLQILRTKDFQYPEVVLDLITDYRNSRQFLAMEKTGRERLKLFMAVLLETVSTTESPNRGFERVFSFVQAITRRTAYLVLLLENPIALKQLIDLCSASPWVVEYLSKYPVLLDELLRPLFLPPEKEILEDELRQQLLAIPDNDFDQQMECLRYFKHVHVLKVAAAELAETMPLMKVSDYLSRIAEVVLQQTLLLGWEYLINCHGYPLNSREESGQLDFVIIAYGKMGGVELNYGSDLDLVFLHNGHQGLKSEAGAGQRALNSRSFYTKLGQRLIYMLNTITLSGRLYEVDMRLRPSGASGPLVSSIKAFDLYQHRDAWTWEHQALVRARPVAGSQELAQKFIEIRKSVLAKPRENNKLRTEITDMRQRMQKELGSAKKKSETGFHLKQDAGGIVDIEFMVQYLVLSWAAKYPKLLDFSDNMRLLETVKKFNLLENSQVKAMMEIYILYRSHHHRAALQNISNLLTENEYSEERKTITTIWNALFAGDEAEE